MIDPALDRIEGGEAFEFDDAVIRKTLSESINTQNIHLDLHITVDTFECHPIFSDLTVYAVCA